jgi:hypothetical protein
MGLAKLQKRLDLTEESLHSETQTKYSGLSPGGHINGGYTGVERSTCPLDPRYPDDDCLALFGRLGRPLSVHLATKAVEDRANCLLNDNCRGSPGSFWAWSQEGSR